MKHRCRWDDSDVTSVSFAWPAQGSIQFSGLT
jgi:hypothetical protein